MENWQMILLICSALGAIAAVLSIGLLLFKAGRWTGTVDTNIGALKHAVEELKNTIKSIDTKLSKLLRLYPDPAIEGSSPLKLTELGERVSDKIGAPDIAIGIARVVSEKVVSMSDYEIQEFAKEYAQSQFEPTSIQSAELDDCAFQEGIPRDSVLSVIGIELRDRLIEMKAVGNQKQS